jgi:hypothetical protein
MMLDTSPSRHKRSARRHVLQGLLYLPVIGCSSGGPQITLEEIAEFSVVSL